jgi:uncharacterized membrane protein
MDTLFAILHVVGAVFIVGPMAILPMSAMRAVRAGNAAQVSTLAKSTNLFALLSLIVFVLGFALVGMADPKYHLSVGTPWVLWSIVLYIVALGLTLFLVVPTMRRASEALEAAPAAAAPVGSADASATPARAGYPAIAAGSGIASLLLVAVVVLMVWKP